jgi:uncharacterized protein
VIDTVLGYRMRFPILRIGGPGAFLAVDPLDHEADAPTVLLPAAEVPADALVGDHVEAFIYLDSDERPIATTQAPKLTLGEVTFLEVTAITPIGAFVDWGLGKELLVPFAEQSKELFVGERQPIGLYLDKTNRLAGTMFVTDMLGRTPRRIGRDEWIDGEAWRNDPDIGLFVILERSYVGLVPASEPHRLPRGAAVKFRVAHIHPDGKLVLSLRQRAHDERATDADAILAVLSRPSPPRVGDKSDPEIIRNLFGLSKKAFKRAIGGLLKDRKVEIDAGGYVVVAKS